MLPRTLTLAEERAINEDTAVMRARVRLAAWTELARALDTLPPGMSGRDRAALLALALKYSEDRPVPAAAVALVQVNGGGARPASEVIRERLATLSPVDTVDGSLR